MRQAPRRGGAARPSTATLNTHHVPCWVQVNGVELMDGSYSQDLHDRATGFSGWQP